MASSAHHHAGHYSNEALALYYLLRVPPYTTLARRLQGGSFDLPDRLFTSVGEAYNMTYRGVDNKELIPQLFCPCPEAEAMLVNRQGLQLGVTQEGTRASDVCLPAWASSPLDFLEKHAACLESNHVSAHIHRWIDLVFGATQRGPLAEEACNLFHHFSYIDDVDALTDASLAHVVESHQRHLGVCPGQVCTHPHPPRDKKERITPAKIRAGLERGGKKLRNMFTMTRHAR